MMDLFTPSEMRVAALLKTLAAEIERLTEERDRLRAALKPFADAVYNDHGDMEVSWVVDWETYVKAYFAMRNPGA